MVHRPTQNLNFSRVHCGWLATILIRSTKNIQAMDSSNNDYNKTLEENRLLQQMFDITECRSQLCTLAYENIYHIGYKAKFFMSAYTLAALK